MVKATKTNRILINIGIVLDREDTVNEIKSANYISKNQSIFRSKPYGSEGNSNYQFNTDGKE